MSTAKDVVTGLTILLKHDPNLQVESKYDVLIAGPGRSIELTEEERNAMQSVGWKFDEEVDGWRIFV